MEMEAYPQANISNRLMDGCVTCFVSFQLLLAYGETFCWCIETLCRYQRLDVRLDTSLSLDGMCHRQVHYCFYHLSHRRQFVYSLEVEGWR